MGVENADPLRRRPGKSIPTVVQFGCVSLSLEVIWEMSDDRVTPCKAGGENMPNLNSKTVLVTGGSRGIGAAIARAIGAAGGEVIVHYARNRDAAEAVRGDRDYPGPGGPAGPPLGLAPVESYQHPDHDPDVWMAKD